MNEALLTRVLGGSSVIMVVFLGGVLFLSFKDNQEKEHQLAARDKEVEKLTGEKKDLEDKLTKKAEEEARRRRALEAQVKEAMKAAEQQLKKLQAERKVAEDRWRAAEVLEKYRRWRPSWIP